MTAKEWNARYPIGTPVEVRRDDGSILPTFTRDVAWNVSGHPVVKVAGIAGGYSLDRVTALATKEP